MIGLLKPRRWRGQVAVAGNSPPAGGGVRRKKDREDGNIPHASVDTEAGWSKSCHHECWQELKLHMITVIGWACVTLLADESALLKLPED